MARGIQCIGPPIEINVKWSLSFAPNFAVKKKLQRTTKY